MNSNKLALLKNKLLFTTYLIFSFFNILIHFFNYYKGFVSMPMEYALYAVKLTICMAICIIVKDEYSVDRPDGSYILHFAHIKSIMKMMISFDLFEIFISVNMTEFEGVAANLIIAAAIAKCILDYKFYMELTRSNLAGGLWRTINILLVVCIVGMASNYERFMTFTIFLMFIRFIFSLVIIVNCHKMDRRDKAEELEDEKYKPFKKPLSGKKIRIISGVVVAVVAVFLWMRYSTATSENVINSNDGTVSIKVLKTFGELSNDDEVVVEYCVCNRMPEGSGFEQKKYGLFNLKTGADTGAIYPALVKFDSDGIAWDHKGHFIDSDGDVVITVPNKLLRTRAAKSTLWIRFFDAFRGKLKSTYHTGYYFFNIIDWFAYGDSVVNYIDWYALNSHNVMCSYEKYVAPNTYFVNGYATYYSEVSGGYGVIDDNGEIILPPELCEVDRRYNYEVTPVVQKSSGQIKIYNKEWKDILNRKRHFINYAIYDSCKLIAVESDNREYYIVMDYNGNLVNPGVEYVSYPSENYGVLLTMLRRKKDKEYIYDTIDGSGNIVLISEKYKDCVALYDSDNSIDCIIAYNCDTEEYDLIDTDGNVIGDHAYSRYYKLEVGSNSILCKVADTGNLDIIHADGTVISTPYKYYWEGTYDYKIGVIREKEDGTSEYNYIDYDGNLIGDEWNELEE